MVSSTKTVSTPSRPKSRKPTRASTSVEPAPPPVEPGCQACGWTPAPGELWPTEGPSAVRWIETNLIFGEGDWLGKPFRLRRDQKRFCYRWFEACPDCGQWHYEEALRGAATGDGKTAFVAAIVAVSFAGPPEYMDDDGVVHGIAPESPNIPVSAASWEQADALFGPLKVTFGGQDDEVEQAPLRGLFEVYDSEIKMRGKPGRLFRTAAIASTNEGGLPTLYVRDELHEWGEQGDRKGRVATVIGKSTMKRRTLRGSGRILSLSTAGFNVDKSLLGEMYKRGKRRMRDPSVAPRYLFDWQEAPDGLDYTRADHREIAVRAASAAADLQWSVRDRVNSWGKPEYPAHEWIRYFANRWVDVTEDSWLVDHPSAWADCAGTWVTSIANPWVIAVDMALYQDSVAVVPVELLPDGRVGVTSKIFTAQGQKGNRINHAEVWDHIMARAKGPGFRGIVYDPRFFELPARIAEDLGVPVIEFPQTAERMNPACGLMFQLIIGTRVVHDNDPDFNRHVLGATRRVHERGFTLSKGRSKGHIDGTIAMVMGTYVLHEVPDETPPPATAAVAPGNDSGSNMFRPTERLEL